ncbi:MULTISPECIES: hypothetical protein [unclassified Bradyrhizobium]|uniref:hypothetical protein n=1 Tax=unclassified Bradyrhizobium TaxID=2631580 RepID=UPI002478BD45|nr:MULTISPECIES: hypothetical protein [unclassified Bradyrhizobium]WGR68437.1 hypothetical protein MTX24_23695 [Bradyrhizobium sp. ISRA426]WGR80492.1 hypothetical protein MTX21_08810 [Bradyrhizobium sp. ISRA430]WGR83677.1 hypothetical protein MTX25_23375 [Bradyrhizobium sp. ISRA432]
MSSTIESIVSAYVRLKNQRALEDMQDLRRQLLGNLQSTSSIDPRKALDVVREDLRVIEQGLEQLRPQPGTLPDTEWR